MRDISDFVTGGALRWYDSASVEESSRSDGAPQELPQHSRIGPYRLESLIGRGGSSLVYRACRCDDAFSQTVAIKVIRRDFDTEAARLERDYLARLTHPYIARIFDAGTADDAYWFAMEYVEGDAIDRHSHAANLDWRARLILIGKVCSAIGQAHELGLVHRDIKPSNILIDRNGDPRVIDFGIALDLRKGTPLAGRAFTVAYASPEQIVGDPATVRSDIYQLGMLVAELLLASPPASSSAAAPPPVIPPASRRNLARVVAKACADDPQQRYPSARALAEDLERAACHKAVRAGGISIPDRFRLLLQRHPLGAAAVLMTFLAATTLLIIDGLNDRTSAERGAEEIQSAEGGRAFLARALANARPSAASTNPLDRLDMAANRTRDLSSTSPLYISALEALTDAYFDAAMDGPARARRLIAAAAAELERDHPDLLEARARIAVLLARCDGAVSALPIFQQSLHHAERLQQQAAIDPRSLSALRLRRQQMYLQVREGKLDQAMALAATLVDSTDTALHTTSEYARVLHTRGHLRWDHNEDSTAVDDLRRAKNLFDAIYGRGYPISTTLAGVIAEIEVMRGSSPIDAARDLHDNLAATDALYEPQSVEAAQARATLGGFIAKWSASDADAAGALTYLEPAYETLSRMDERFVGLTVGQDYAAALMASGRFPEAVRVLQTTLAQRMRYGNARSPYVVWTQLVLADAECHAGQAGHAMTSFDEIAGSIEKDASARWAVYWILRSRCLLQQQRLAEARSAFQQIARAEPDANSLARRRYRRLETQLESRLAAAAPIPPAGDTPSVQPR